MFVVELSYLFVLPARKKYKVPINGLCRGQMVVNVNATEWHTGFCPTVQHEGYTHHSTFDGCQHPIEDTTTLLENNTKNASIFFSSP